MKRKSVNPISKHRLLPLLPFIALILWSCTEQDYDLVTVEGSEQPTGQALLLNTIRVNGLVFGDSDPLAGARVDASGGSIGAVTDREGYFELDVPEGSSITISSRGFSTSTLMHILWREPHDHLTVGVRLYKDRVHRIRSAPAPRPSIYVIDGIIKRDMSGVDFRNIERTTTLRGESAIREYGEQARAGALIVKTKK